MSGSSVYVLSLRGASDEAAKWLADSENAADLKGGVSLDDSSDVLASVLLDVTQKESISDSVEAADSVLTALRGVGNTHGTPRVRHAGFIVLKSPDIPSMLVETAFISNATDERRLRDPGHQAAHCRGRAHGRAQLLVRQSAARLEAGGHRGRAARRHGGHRHGRRRTLIPAALLCSRTRREPPDSALPSMPIRVLPEQLVHQIAAGEVVERPASVIKELVENSLDAGALAIDIEVEKGGAELCRVRDDGMGIAADELLLALARHATSKIGSIDDLEAVRTLGFRGEALPSIASVSRMRMISRPRAAETAHMVAAVDGALTGPAPHPHPHGTTVEVRDLFFNVPARRKFLRSERTELSQIERLVERLALSRFDVGFRLSSARKVLADHPPARDERARDARVAAMLGEDFIANAMKLDHEGSGLRLHGWFCLPTYARSQADQQYFFLNGRPLRDKLIASAVRLAYRDVLFHGRHPAYVLFLEMDPTRVDVNAHPQKLEVRFREPGLIHDFLFRTLERALAETRPTQSAADSIPAARADWSLPGNASLDWSRGARRCDSPRHAAASD